MATLLFPGRHIVNTRFQEEYLFQVLQRPLAQLDILGQTNIPKDQTLDKIIFAITSINQEHSRYNPINGMHRFISVDRFAQQFRIALGVDVRIVGIPHYHAIGKFAQYTLKEISEQTEQEIQLHPKNTLVLSSTPAVQQMYQQLGFAILPAELQSLNPKQYRAPLPIDIVKKIAATAENWQQDGEIRTQLSPATISTWIHFPEIAKKVIWLYKDPLLNEHGSLTATRDYFTYTQGMSNPLILEAKYNDIKHSIVTGGRIVDEGCADGALLARIAQDFPDVDILGIEITAEYIEQCREKQRQGAFRANYAHFHQRNLMERIFEDNSITTTICNSTTHELWSYGEQQNTIQKYLDMKYQQLCRSGRIIIRDVVGPQDKEKIIYLHCNKNDGSNENIHQSFSDPQELSKHLQNLSTYARFQRFAQDFLFDMRKKAKRDEQTKIQYQEKVINQENYIILSLKDAAEFLSKKDYTDNWQSELNEEFAFWSYSQWKEVLKKTGFKIIENPNDPLFGSKSYASEWIIQNRYKGKVQLYEMSEKKLKPLDYPVTNMVLVGEKP